ncbi:MAG: hypothetical protein NVS4B13_03510 [Candidatus Elarobacter sp.]
MTPSRFLRFVLPLGLALTCGAGGAAAPAATNAGAGGLATPDYRIETDETHWNFNSGEFTMPHRVRFTRPGTDAVSARATGNSKQGTATLIGDVVVHDSGNAAEAGDAAYKGSGAATLTCNRLEIDSKSKLYTAIGNVHFSQGTRSGSAARAVLNRATGMLHLEGDVHMSNEGSTLVANMVDYNMNSKDVEVHGAPAVMTQPANREAQPPPVAPARATPSPKARKKP